jgi:hypothetical protein
MAVALKEPKSQPVATLSPAAPVVPAPAVREPGPTVFRGDVVFFLFWAICFLLMAFMIAYETIAGIFRH